MFDKYQSSISRLIDGAVHTAGETDSGIREQIIALGKNLIGSPSQAPESLSPELAAFVEKITFSPFDIGDEDITFLKLAGYSDDAILEIISCASLAAGIGRLELAAAAMEKEGKNA